MPNCYCACNGYYDDFIKNITFSTVREMLSNTTLFHPVQAARSYGYITLVILQRKAYFRVKKECENISWEKYVQARAFWRNGSYAPVRACVCVIFFHAAR